MAAFLRAGFLASVLAFGWAAYALTHHQFSAEIEQWTETSGLAEVFYGQEPGQYTPAQRVQWLTKSQDWQRLHATYEGKRRVASIRVDPSAEPGRVRIGEIRFTSRWGMRSFQGEPLHERLFGVNDGEFVAVGDDYLEFLSTGVDPHFSLDVPRALFRPEPAAVLVPVLQIAFAVFAIWLGLEFGGRALQRRFPRQVHNAVDFLARRFPEGAGRWATERPATVILVGTALVLPLLMIAHVQVAKTTPFFQGPDEGAHITNSFHGFNNLAFGGLGTCNETWDELNTIQGLMQKLVRRHLVNLTHEDIEALAQVRTRSVWTESDRTIERAQQSSCASSNVIHRYAYNALTVPVFMLRDDVGALDYLIWLRHGQTVFAFTLYLVILLIIARGSFVLSGMVTINEGLLRVLLALAVVAYISIPQNIFMLSVVNREAYLVPLGILIFVSFLFRIRGLTLLLMIFAVYAFWPRKAVYLPYIVLLATWYLAVFLTRRRQSAVPILGLTAATAVLIVLVPPVLTWLHGHRELLFDTIPRRMKLFDGWDHYYREIVSITQDVYTLAILDSLSFFGRFGWLDTVHPAVGVTVFKGIFVTLVLVFLFSIIWARKQGFRVRWDSIREVRSAPILLFFLVALPFVVSLMAYAIMEDFYGHICLPWRWGCGVQGRYFLPIYFYIFAYSFFAGFVLFLARPAAERARAVGFSLLLLSGVMAAAIGYNLGLMVNILELRYFEDEGVLNAYRQILRPGGGS